jgi:hypothetical protein
MSGDDVRVGASAPEFEYRIEGRQARLSELWSEGPALVLWLRHCG